MAIGEIEYVMIREKIKSRASAGFALLILYSIIYLLTTASLLTYFIDESGGSGGDAENFMILIYIFIPVFLPIFFIYKAITYASRLGMENPSEIMVIAYIAAHLLIGIGSFLPLFIIYSHPSYSSTGMLLSLGNFFVKIMQIGAIILYVEVAYLRRRLEAYSLSSPGPTIEYFSPPPYEKKREGPKKS